MIKFLGLGLAVLGMSLNPGFLSRAQAITAQDVAAVSSVTTLTAKVVDVHHASQKLTLEGAKGNILKLKVDGKAKNFKNIKKGDMVKVEYYDSIAWEINKPVKGQEPAKTVTEVKSTAPPGQKPGIEEVEITHILATIEKIDKANSSVVLKVPDGSFTFKVKDPKALEAVKVGDQVSATYTEAWAISVEPAQ